jgi:hypothetical protein
MSNICVVCAVALPDPLEEYGERDAPMCQQCYLSLIDPSQREQVYGFFPGGDPRDFTPDTESCTPEEIARWKADCELVERGEPIDASHSCEWHELPGGGLAHVLAPRYGIGVYLFPTRQLAPRAARED